MKIAPRTCEFLHPGRQMSGVAQSGVVDIEIVIDGANHDLPRVHANADL